MAAQLARPATCLFSRAGSPPTACPDRAAMQACIDSIQDALAEAGGGGGSPAAARVKAIGVSGQQHGLVALDADGHVIRPGAPAGLRLGRLAGVEVGSHRCAPPPCLASAAGSCSKAVV